MKKFDLKQKLNTLQADIAALFIALKAPKTPWYAKALAFLTVAYALSPIDLIPDFIPVLGYLDDALLLPALVALTVRCIPKEVWQDAREKAAKQWQNGKPQKWYYALPVIAVWLILLIVLLQFFLPKQ